LAAFTALNSSSVRLIGGMGFPLSQHAHAGYNHGENKTKGLA
jgi:hypothetical protein